MSTKAAVFWGMIIGSTIGGFIPSLWGSGLFSYAGILGNAIGGIVGIFVGFKLSNN